MKKQRFPVGMEVAVCQDGYLCAVTTVTALGVFGVRTKYSRKYSRGKGYGATWTATGLEPLESGASKRNRQHIRAVTDADMLELDRRDLVQDLKEVNWDKIELSLLIGVRVLLSGGEGVKLRSVPG